MFYDHRSSFLHTHSWLNWVVENIRGKYMHIFHMVKAIATHIGNRMIPDFIDIKIDGCSCHKQNMETSI